MRRALRVCVGVVFMAGLAVAVLPGSAGASPGLASQLFRNCDEARVAGYSNMRTGQPGYSADLDGNSNGVACEEGESLATPMAPAVPAPNAQAVPPTEVQGATQEALAQTGVSMLTPVLLVAAVALMFAGQRVIEAGYERLNWLSGRRHSHVRFTVEPVRRRRR